MQACAVGNFVMTQWDISPLTKTSRRDVTVVFLQRGADALDL